MTKKSEHISLRPNQTSFKQTSGQQHLEVASNPLQDLVLSQNSSVVEALQEEEEQKVEEVEIKEGMLLESSSENEEEQEEKEEVELNWFGDSQRKEIKNLIK